MKALSLCVFLAATSGCGADGPDPSKADGDDGGVSGGFVTANAASAQGSGGGGVGGATTVGDGGSTAMSSSSSGSGLPTPMVDWISWGPQQNRQGATWGSALTDIANHLPSQYGTTYDDSDLVTFGHETSHGIHAHLRNYENNTGKKANAFYVLGDEAAIVVEPGITKSQVASYVPQSLRDFRYGTYVTGAGAWDNEPLYLWDEWVAYTNGAEVGVNRVNEGVWSEGWRDQSGNLEFVVYGLAVGMAVRDLDSEYWQDYDQFREFMMWQTERSMDLFHTCEGMTEFESTSVASYYEAFKTSSDAEGLRQFVRDTYGDAWTVAVLGF